MFDEKSFTAELRNGRFANFVALKHEDSDEPLSMVLWRNANGRRADHVKFIFSGRQVFIGGDLGDAVINLTEKATLENLARYSPGYVVEKISCTADKYRFDKEAAMEALNREVASIIEHIERSGDFSVIEQIEQKGDLKDLVNEFDERFSERDGFLGASCAKPMESLLEYDSEIAETLASAGRYIAPRVYMWLTAAQMAHQLLFKAE